MLQELQVLWDVALFEYSNAAPNTAARTPGHPVAVAVLGTAIEETRRFSGDWKNRSALLVRVKQSKKSEAV